MLKILDNYNSEIGYQLFFSNNFSAIILVN